MQIEFYEDQANEWRWRARADNDEIIADCGEGYANLADCEGGLIALAKGLRTHARVVELGKDGGQSVGNLHALMAKHDANEGA